MTIHAENQLTWSEMLGTRQTDCSTDEASFGVVYPYADNGSKLKEAIAVCYSTVSNIAGITVIQNNYTTYDNYTAYFSFSITDARATEPAGISSLLSSRLMPRRLFNSPSSITSVVDVVLYGIGKAGDLIQIRTTRPRCICHGGIRCSTLSMSQNARSRLRPLR